MQARNRAAVRGPCELEVGGVRFRAPAPQASGPYAIEVELRYQTLGSRFADELFQVNTPEVKAFQGYWQKATRTPVLVDRVNASAN